MIIRTLFPGLGDAAIWLLEKNSDAGHLIDKKNRQVNVHLSVFY